MSRIEMAMEKAALLRQGMDPPTFVEPPKPVKTRVEPAPPVLSPEKRLAPRDPFLVNLRPTSAVAEEYRKLKSALVKMTKGDHFRNTVMVTSSVPDEGKSLTALNLAMSLAQELDHTVLLVDADLRRPSVHRYLDVDQGVGLAEILTGECGIAETILPTGIGKLSVIRAGRAVDSPSELFSSQRMKELVAEVKNRYSDRYVIFDTPPVLPFAETRSLANLVDGVLFVVMERLASPVNIREALDSLKGSHMLGVVYNAAEITANDARYSYYKYQKSGIGRTTAGRGDIANR